MADAVRAYWEQQACGTEWAVSARYTPAYFEEIEAARYRFEPAIPAFAKFAQSAGQQVLEVGVGAGTDFVQWARAGARAFGVDLTDEALNLVRRRLAIEGLTGSVQRADCEALPFKADAFDLVYSWGVIHHTADTERALAEIVRVCRPGGVIRLMLYNRHSLLAFYLWIRWALLAGQPWRPISSIIARHMESPGTKAFTAAEVDAMLRRHPVRDVSVRGILTRDDRLELTRIPLARRVASQIARLAGDRFGWFLAIECRKAAGA